MGNRNRKFKILFGIIFILMFTYLIVSLNIFNKENLFDFFTTGKESKGFGIFYIVAITLLMVFFVPISWFSALGAFLFGWRGYIYIIIGGMLASILAFYIAKLFREDVIKLVSKVYYRKERDVSLEEVSRQIEKHGMGYVFFMRSMPFIPFSVANYVSGLSSISLKDYILGTILGLVPGQFITTYFFVKAIDIKENPLGAVVAAVVKGAYILLVILWQKKSKYSTKE
ncbi:putative membrane protein YdjX (TVP38/TMEM64 family) [Keratinibaculum paraultunense]|uniref:TVP38/TMEM64 family membrane protein n=1 Tax=Keratinibaculum paraultunense TaxID=1278232 RepID=A0A4V2UUM6_9FIRM|nr:VTT domain-containing protein [Keratinibaculum paraultunense]QQY80079.1 TVP38/TMEM64 family protein [Keratinibaculum paraultunense]TCS91600.1 putative membrane protein YdjX (TVP38/TMEM64 family) [Keratinibaculum paraultunense]